MDSKLSKSHVLAGVQDAYWSDDEGEDAECPLCLEEMDLSDMGFKPCPCGYQICRFCWHHIKENLNGRCPACRREYTEESVEFNPVNSEDVRRINQQKKSKEKERKELEALGRRNLTNVRVVQRNVVYITGVGPRFAREELIPTLRSNDYFGQYGKISKILLVKRTSPSGGDPVVGLYVTYHRREDASRAIQAVDGTPSPSGNGELIRASYGTTKYCISFLRGVGCSNKGCLDSHEWGDERDCFTKEDLTTLKHTIKESESSSRKQEGLESLPKRPNWNTASSSSRQTGGSSSLRSNATTGPGARRHATTKEPAIGSRSSKANKPAPLTDGTSSTRRERERDREKDRSKRPSSAVSSTQNQKALLDTNSRPSSPAIAAMATATGRASTPAESDRGSSIAESTNSPRLEHSLAKSGRPLAPQHSASTKNAAKVPPGLAPPQQKASSSQDQPKGLPLSSSYQPSTAAQALLDDVRLRRQRSTSQTDGSTVAGFSPFPDFDRTLKNLGLTTGSNDGDGGLKFTFDFNIDDDAQGLLDSTAQPFSFDQAAPVTTPASGISSASYTGSFNPFDISQTQSSEHAGWSTAPAFGGFSVPASAPLPQDPPSAQASYRGSFDPFADSDSLASGPRPSPALSFSASVEGERTTSRFGFARRPTPAGRSATIQSGRDSNRGSPLINSPADALPSSPFVSTLDVISPRPSTNLPHWTSGASLSRPESTQTGPPGLSQTTSISLSQLFGSNYARRNSLRSTESPLSPPPGLGATQRAGTESAPRSMANHFNEQGGFVDPAIMRAGPAPPGLSLSLERPIYSTNPSSMDVGSPSFHSSTQMESSLPTPSDSVPDDAVPARMRSLSRSNPSGTNSVVGVSIPPTPLHVFPASSIPSSPVDEGYKSPKFQASDFPALPTASNGDSQARVEPHIQIAAPKVSEAPRVATKPEPKKEPTKRKNTLDPGPKVIQLEEPKKEEKKKAAKTSAKAAGPTNPKLPADTVIAAAAPIVFPPIAKDAKEKEVVKEAAKEVKEKEKSEKPKPVAKTPSAAIAATENQAPLLSRQSKKERNKPKPKAVKPNASEENLAESSAADTASPNVASSLKVLPTGPEGPRGPTRHAHGANTPVERIPVSELLRVIDGQGTILLNDLNFFNSERISPKSQAPLQYGPLVHALSALSVGGGTFSNNLPSRSIDTAVSSFQTLLETLTQTISDLLRLLPRTTWDDSTSFDGVLRDMLKGEDFFDDPGEEGAVKSDEVAALTQALERRARWMEVQLSKLEELHRDINTAAVQAVLSLNDKGWDATGFLPRQGGSLARFEGLPFKDGKGEKQFLGAVDLERKLEKALENERAVENDLRKSVDAMLLLKYQAQDEWTA